MSNWPHFERATSLWYEEDGGATLAGLALGWHGTQSWLKEAGKTNEDERHNG